jgi:hypothetical protein
MKSVCGWPPDSRASVWVDRLLRAEVQHQPDHRHIQFFVFDLATSLRARDCGMGFAAQVLDERSTQLCLSAQCTPWGGLSVAAFRPITAASAEVG